jgi:protein tyrosine phosphatase
LQLLAQNQHVHLCVASTIDLFNFDLTQSVESSFFRYSAGVGRTGVFITLSIVLERMRYEAVIDMFQTVNMLRTQRPLLVQSEVRGHLQHFVP